MDVQRSQLVVPALSVALLLGFGIVGNPGLGIAADVLTPGGPGGPEDGTDSPAADGGASVAVGPTATAAMDDSREARSDDADGGPDAAGPRAGDDGSYADGEADLSLLSPDSALAATLRGPLYLLDNTDSPLAATLRATDDTVDASGRIVDGTTRDVGDAVDDTTGDVGDAVDDTADGTTDGVTDEVEDTTDDVTDEVEDTTDSTTDEVENTTDGVTDEVADTTDTLVGDSTPTPTDSSTESTETDGSLLDGEDDSDGELL